MVLLGYPAGKITAAERNRGELPAGKALRRPAAAGLGVACERERKQERHRQQREGDGSHT
jgi:hypothetical protein